WSSDVCSSDLSGECLVVDFSVLAVHALASEVLETSQRFPCGVSADTGDPFIPGAGQVVLLLIGQVSDLRGGEGLPVAFGDLGGGVGGHAHSFSLSAMRSSIRKTGSWPSTR